MKYYKDNEFVAKNNDKPYIEWQKVDEDIEWPGTYRKHTAWKTRHGHSDLLWYRIQRDTYRRVEGRQSIADRWTEVEAAFRSDESRPDAKTLPLTPREKAARLGGLAIAGMGGEVALAYTNPPLAILMGASLAGVGIANYVARRPRGGDQSKSPELPPAKTTTRNTGEDLIYETVRVLRHAYGGVMLDYGGLALHEFEPLPEHTLDAVLPQFVHTHTSSDKLKDVLRWIDAPRLDQTLQSTASIPRSDDDVYCDGLLRNAYSNFHVDGVAETFGLPPNHSTPLSVLALARMNDRATFVDAFRDKFDALAECRTDAYDALIAVNQSASFTYSPDNAQYNELHERYCRTIHAVRMTDLHIASLAYLYDRKRMAVEELRVISRGHLPQPERWEAALGTLCPLPLTGLSAPMQELLTNTVDLCSSMAAMDNYGEKAERIVQLIASAQMDVDDENRHTSVWREIQSVAYDQL